MFEDERLADNRLNGVFDFYVVAIESSFTTLGDIREVDHECQLAGALAETHGTIVMWRKRFGSRVSIVPKSWIQS